MTDEQSVAINRNLLLLRQSVASLGATISNLTLAVDKLTKRLADSEGESWKGNGDAD